MCALSDQHRVSGVRIGMHAAPSSEEVSCGTRTKYPAKCSRSAFGGTIPCRTTDRTSVGEYQHTIKDAEVTVVDRAGLGLLAGHHGLI